MVAAVPNLKDPDYYDEFVKFDKEEVDDDDLKEIEEGLEALARQKNYSRFFRRRYRRR